MVVEEGKRGLVDDTVVIYEVQFKDGLQNKEIFFYIGKLVR